MKANFYNLESNPMPSYFSYVHSFKLLPNLHDDSTLKTIGIQARKIQMQGCDSITDDGFRHLRGPIEELDIRKCKFLTSAIFKYLVGVKKLNMSNCHKMDAMGFKYLKGSIKQLNMSFCFMDDELIPITDQDFRFLKGIKRLSMTRCYMETVTDKAFEPLKGYITHLDIGGCLQFTNNAFKNLLGTIKVLRMDSCRQISDDAFQYLKGTIKTLDISYCNSRGKITDKAFSYLSGIKKLRMSCCNQKSITDKAFEPLKGSITHIDMSGCTQFTDKAFENFTGTLRKINMSGCNQKEITNIAFYNMRGSLRYLYMSDCNQSTITDGALNPLKKTLQTLETMDCNQKEITDAFFNELYKIENLSIGACQHSGFTEELFKSLIQKGKLKRLELKLCLCRDESICRTDRLKVLLGKNFISDLCLGAKTAQYLLRFSEIN